MIDEKALWYMLDQLQSWTTYVDDTDDSNHVALQSAINQVMADLDTNSTPELCQDEPPPIPDGVPCWVIDCAGKRHLRVATGERDRYYTFGYETGRTESAAPGSMRPVCFPEWDHVPEWAAFIELFEVDGAWSGFVGQDTVKPRPGSYYERRPR
jgi:hypothetical protein